MEVGSFSSARRQTSQGCLKSRGVKVFPEGPIKEAEYYISERNGVRSDGEDIVIDDASGGERKLPWTLSVYLKASRVRYKSRAMINCVQKLKCMCECLGTHGPVIVPKVGRYGQRPATVPSTSQGSQQPVTTPGKGSYGQRFMADGQPSASDNQPSVSVPDESVIASTEHTGMLTVRFT